MIREARKAKAMTQAELAVRLGIAQTTVAAWERGASAPVAKMLPLIAKVLGCSIEALYDEEDRRRLEKLLKMLKTDYVEDDRLIPITYTDDVRRSQVWVKKDEWDG